MSVGDGCTVGAGGIVWNYLPPTVAGFTQVRVPPANWTSGPQIQGAVQLVQGTALSGFNITLHLVSGPGPTYTNEVLLAQLSGAIAPGAQARGTFPSTQNMPNAGRPFNPTTDGFRATYNDQFQLSGSPAGAQFDFGACPSAGSLTDCCAELNQKLDQVLAFVSGTRRNLP